VFARAFHFCLVDGLLGKRHLFSPFFLLVAVQAHGIALNNELGFW
jgi:hypothetical protein